MFSKKLTLFFISVLLFALPSISSAATLRFSPSSGTYNIGQTISASILVNSSDQAMNAASGIISFPTDLLQVTSLSKGGSIMSLWVKEPSYSNTDGRVNFEGVVLNPGFTGSAGNVITINFKVKSSGTAQVGFETAQILANDGNGTNILSRSDGAEFSLNDGGEVIKSSTPTISAENAASISVKELPREKTNPDTSFVIKVTDKTFTTDHLEISINGAASKTLPLSKDNVYDINDGNLGKNSLKIRAVSKNGSFLEASAEFFIESLIPPTINEYPSSNDGRTPITIKGITKYPHAKVTLLFRRDKEIVLEEPVTADEDGAFAYVNAHEMVNGDYVVSAYVTLDSGAKSSESKPITIHISSPFIVYLGTLAINIFFAVLVLMVIIVALGALTLYVFFRLKAYRHKVRKEAVEAEESLKKSIKLLKEDVSESVSSKQVADELKHDIDEVEKFVGKEIKDIESLH